MENAGMEYSVVSINIYDSSHFLSFCAIHMTRFLGVNFWPWDMSSNLSSFNCLTPDFAG
jgi:hypothetical protein